MSFLLQTPDIFFANCFFSLCFIRRKMNPGTVQTALRLHHRHTRGHVPAFLTSESHSGRIVYLCYKKPRQWVFKSWKCHYWAPPQCPPFYNEDAEVSEAERLVWSFKYVFSGRKCCYALYHSHQYLTHCLFLSAFRHVALCHCLSPLRTYLKASGHGVCLGLFGYGCGGA